MPSQTGLDSYSNGNRVTAGQLEQGERQPVGPAICPVYADLHTRDQAAVLLSPRFQVGSDRHRKRWCWTSMASDRQGIATMKRSISPESEIMFISGAAHDIPSDVHSGTMNPDADILWVETCIDPHRSITMHEPAAICGWRAGIAGREATTYAVPPA